MASKINQYESEVLQLIQEGKSLAQVSRWLGERDMTITRQSIRSWFTRRTKRKASRAHLFSPVAVIASHMDEQANKTRRSQNDVTTVYPLRKSSIESFINAGEAQLSGQLAGDMFLAKPRSAKHGVTPNNHSNI